MSAPSSASALIPRRGMMLVLSSPSGAGKTTISRALLAEEDGLEMSVSVTTRPPRPGERDGEHYHFIDVARYMALTKDDGLLEHARVFENYYGTPRAPVEAALAMGRDVLFDIDWQGTQQVAEKARADLVSIFILPPSVGELERRLKGRAQDSDAVVAARMAKAMDEISHYFEYDYIIVNDDLDRSIADVRAILRAERLKRARRIGLAGFVNRMRGAEE
ncbi:guanylate kinase [Rhodospirillum rubrum]|uniref:guanylate kinase n=1 Tax=Rhodospirillum rubrum TaxID=1085 RepID=UPI001902D156|nr:guanylate kinase [Rhodospirillum rubrum]MBK1663769.1 guanylate kinase [Rhodospirillum rubrum]MBK1676688.1 guanylate kinase [Rhodospirillum rubrum]